MAITKREFREIAVNNFIHPKIFVDLLDEMAGFMTLMNIAAGVVCSTPKNKWFWTVRTLVEAGFSMTKCNEQGISPLVRFLH